MKRIVLSLLAQKGSKKRLVGQYLHRLGAHVISVKDVLTSALELGRNTVLCSEIKRHMDSRMFVPGEILAEVLMPKLKPLLRQDPNGLFVLNGMGFVSSQLSVLEERLRIFKTRSHSSPIENIFALLRLRSAAPPTDVTMPLFLPACATDARVKEFESDPDEPGNVAVQIYAWAYSLSPDSVAEQLARAS